MLSILIPTYNYNVFPLVKEVREQCIAEKLSFEIIVLDDASQNFYTENNEINSLDNCSYSVLNQNIGRSSIRNLLSTKASFDNLLFLDADVRIISNQFIKNYVNFIKSNSNYGVVYGGIIYQESKPNNDQLLRWIYGNKREALSAEKRNENVYVSFLTLNFLIKKEIFRSVRFNEDIPNLRYEDLLFSFDLMKNKISLQHINNQVVHNGIETSEVFMQKTNDSLKGLKFLLSKNYLTTDYAKISAVFNLLNQTKLLFLIKFIYKMQKNSFEKNLLSSKPSLFIYDIYRLGYFSQL
ncbi:glycosyltransferase family 2 protein [Paenimyroides baculatum]|uniref:Glycosyltransferase family 2 protein n=1 Tax=Paenimyroides baculatum TaxID=2608000 RepID=A0A5M6CJU1_9FLAO|nr:glycosyltransferase [Paenimyroides baculatum]KAA5535293.1 glycosyltransferase family 2 protein [Paenimyroides baculatum]